MPADSLTLQDLKSHLWNCAQISAIDRTDWKGYILPLLFFKRISDVWDEEAAEARAEYGDIDLGAFPELHRFRLPTGCHWQDVRGTPANVGAPLAQAMRPTERANPDTLARVFCAADWGNREMLGDELLKDLIEALPGVPPGNAAVLSVAARCCSSTPWANSSAPPISIPPVISSRTRPRPYAFPIAGRRDASHFIIHDGDVLIHLTAQSLPGPIHRTYMPAARR